MSLVSSLTAPGAHGQIFCSDLVFFHWCKSPRRQRKRVESVKADPKRPEERLSHTFYIECQALIYMTSDGVCDSDQRPRDLSHASLLEKTISF